MNLFIQYLISVKLIKPFICKKFFCRESPEFIKYMKDLKFQTLLDQGGASLPENQQNLLLLLPERKLFY